MNEYRVALTRVILDYYEVDVQANNEDHATGKALRTVKGEPARHQLAQTDTAYIPTAVRQL